MMVEANPAVTATWPVPAPASTASTVISTAVAATFSAPGVSTEV